MLSTHHFEIQHNFEVFLSLVVKKHILQHLLSTVVRCKQTPLIDLITEQ